MSSWEKVTVPKGHHYVNGQMAYQVHIGKVMSYMFKFKSDSIYLASSWENQYDLNKMPGFSGCVIWHHSHSARFGWAWIPNWMHRFGNSPSSEFQRSEWKTIAPTLDITDGRLEIHDYVYYEGERLWSINGYPDTFMMSPVIGEKYRAKILHRKWRRKWELSIDDEMRVRPAPFCLSPVQAKLRFYIGGDDPAQHDMDFHFKKLKG